MTALIINRDVQFREYQMLRAVPSGLATRQQVTWSAATSGNPNQEIFLPGNEVIVPQPNNNYIMSVSWIWADPVNAPSAETNSTSEVFGGTRWVVRRNGTITFHTGYGGVNIGAPPADLTIGMDFVPLPNVPGVNYLRVRLRGFPGAEVNWGLFGTIFAAPRTR